ncbi:nucleotidyltransferase family protein [Shewanella sp. FJAT-52076]|uniref:nucleotidyltransferase family protein n=1 Tax=Shewanella sp. FJAT-52076 TaxID=2864202 RepID=UPI001C65CC69|nr:nucleotidyltransferase family protein [Shewanella sp. FJAT-52076]QYJ76706.1 nucleotidyltransferase family protein [Shewanella sp. FJAT-52076]
MRLSTALTSLLRDDDSAMDCLKAAREVMTEAGIGDYLLAAGFVRQRVWDSLHGMETRQLADVDLIYWGAGERALEQRLTEALGARLAVIPWEVKDQRRMHLRHGDAPYRNLVDAMAAWPEQETAVGVRLTHEDTFHIESAWGLESLFALKLTPSPRRPIDVFWQRVRSKGWLEHYPKLQLVKP